jgi:choline-sulfatase
MDKPNIVMIMADQMAFDVIGALGHPTVKTPNIDRLVHNGVSFSNCYCNSPLCAPSRASFVTGKLVSRIAAFDNGSELPAGTPTFVHHLRRSGYETVLSGKMHYVGPDQLHGFEHRLTRDIHATGFELTPDWSRGTYPNPGTGVKRLKDAGITDWNNHLAYDDKVQFRAIEKIRDYGRIPEPDRKPFFLCASFFHPHDPFVITKPYWDLYDDSDIPMPASPGCAYEEMHPFNQWIQTHHEVDTCRLTEGEIRANRRAYYGMVTYIDDKVGEIVGELTRLGLLENTIIMITSDHGEMLGEHGMWFKRTYYEPSVKVPLILSGPKYIPGGRAVKDVVSLVDLSATIMELAGVPEAGQWINEMDGDSFMPMLKGEPQEWKNEAISEYYGEGALRPMIVLREGNYKYVHISGHDALFYDLDQDPMELKDAITDPKYATVVDRMRDRILEQFDLEDIERQVRQSQKERLMIAEALKAGQTWKWQPPITGLSRDW